MPSAERTWSPQIRKEESMGAKKLSTVGLKRARVGRVCNQRGYRPGEIRAEKMRSGLTRAGCRREPLGRSLLELPRRLSSGHECSASWAEHRSRTAYRSVSASFPPQSCCGVREDARKPTLALSAAARISTHQLQDLQSVAGGFVYRSGCRLGTGQLARTKEKSEKCPERLTGGCRLQLRLLLVGRSRSGSPEFEKAAARGLKPRGARNKRCVNADCPGQSPGFARPGIADSAECEARSGGKPRLVDASQRKRRGSKKTYTVRSEVQNAA
jgi:hypothetical protein